MQLVGMERTTIISNASWKWSESPKISVSTSIAQLNFNVIGCNRVYSVEVSFETICSKGLVIHLYSEIPNETSKNVIAKASEENETYFGLIEASKEDDAHDEGC